MYLYYICIFIYYIIYIFIYSLTCVNASLGLLVNLAALSSDNKGIVLDLFYSLMLTKLRPRLDP